ncbi:MAG: formate/nitrite transporter family protein [Clostridia bacterium]|nr:formate/nitrite transporter family protein [Clostridia bacterium]
MTNKEAAVKYSTGGAGKASMSVLRMAAEAFLAGMFIALAGAASTIAASTIESPSVAKLVTALIFPAGLAMVILNGTELFTGNSLMIISLLDKKIKLTGVLKNWLIVYAGNFAGSLFVSAMCVYGHVYTLFGGAAGVSAGAAAAAKCSISFEDAVLKGILCNILVCVAVMMTVMTEHAVGKIIALFLPIMVFVICGFEHSVANMSYISTGLFLQVSGQLDSSINAENLTWGAFLITNLVPVTLGNIIGGCFTGFAYWFTNIYKTA